MNDRSNAGLVIIMQLVPPGEEPLMPCADNATEVAEESDSVDVDLRVCQPCNHQTKQHEICMTNLKTWICSKATDETAFDWMPCNCGASDVTVAHGSKQEFFSDSEDPRRLPFDESLDYTRDTRGFQDSRVQNLYRNLQIANQMHKCCFTCFKYCFKNYICRFGYPRSLAALKKIFEESFKEFADPVKQGMDAGYMVHKTDANGRKRSLVHSAFNNAHLNSHAYSPLLMIAQHANMDVKFMADRSGTVEYIGSYISKTEEPDFVKIGNIFVKRIAGISRSGKSLTDLQKLNAVGNALIDAQVVGAPQMCFLLIGLPFVKFSRPVEVINPLHRSNIRIKVLNSVERQFVSTEVSALSAGLSSHLGKRQAYSEFLLYNKKRFGNYGNVTYYAMRTMYTTKLKPVTTEGLSKQQQQKQSEKQSKRRITELAQQVQVDEDTGFINLSAKSFTIGKFQFTRRRKAAVLHLSPHVPINLSDERSAYMILLLHRVWPNGLEENILENDRSAVETLSTCELPSYVHKLLGIVQQSEKSLEELREDIEANKLNKSLGMFQQRIPLDSRPTELEATESDDEGSHEEDPVDNMADGYDGVDHTEGNVEDNLFDDQTSSFGDARLESTPFKYLNTEEHIAAVQFIEQAMLKFGVNQKDVLKEASGVIHLGPNGCSLREEGQLPYIPVENYEERRRLLMATISTFDKEQALAFNKVKEALSNNTEQLIMFVSGEGGTGKSHLIKAISEQAAIMFGKTRGKHGSVVKFAPTGNAAFNIGGCTWQSGIRKEKYRKKDAANARSLKIADDLKDARLIIIDEISMVSLEALDEISTAVSKALATLATSEEQKQKILESKFGGLHVVFVGDLYQLPAVKQTPVYASQIRKVAAERGKVIWLAINYYVRLIVNHRVKTANMLEQHFAAALSIFRVGGMAQPMIDYLNTHNLVINEKDCIAKAHPVWYTIDFMSESSSFVLLPNVACSGRFVAISF